VVGVVSAVAVAVMAKAPEAGLVKTRLCPPLSPAAAAELADAFLRDAWSGVRALDGVVPAVVYAPDEARGFFETLAPGAVLFSQRGADLGARLAHAFDDLLALDVAGAVVIGSDAPTLPRAILTDAVAKIGAADLVIGPSDDGGYYLIGLRAPRPELFTGIAWSTDTVFDATIARARAAGLSTAVVPSWFDVDTPEDLDRLASSLEEPGARAPHTRRVLAAQGRAARA
jgi:rSAM/selenodomain-associated transferase 1